MSVASDETHWRWIRMPSLALRRALLPVMVVAAIIWFSLSVLPGFGTRLGPTGSGLLTLAAMLLAAVYGLRRRFLLLSLYLIRPFVVIPSLRRFRSLAVQLDQLRHWRVAHLAIGTLCVLPFWWHVSVAQGGVIETMLYAVVVLVIASGVLGAVLQYAIPQSILRSIERQVRVRDVRDKQRAIFVDAEERILGRSEMLVDAYLTAVRPVLQGETSRLRLFEATVRRQDPGALMHGAAWRFLERLDEKDAETYRGLISLAEQKGRLDLNLFQLKLSTGWLIFHDAAVACGAALVVLHIFSVLYFGGL